MTNLTRKEKDALEACEEVIRTGLEEFRRVGEALQRIRDEKLYRAEYETFKEYCREKWDISSSYSYQLSQASEVAQQIESSGGSPPTISSHAAKLHIISSEKYRIEAWEEVRAVFGDNATARDIQTIARKYYVLERGGPIANKVASQEMSPRRAYDLTKKLDRLPEYYEEAVTNRGLEGEGVAAETLTAIRKLEYSSKKEALDILRSGFLDNGRAAIPLHELSPRDVNAFARRLAYEDSQANVLKAKGKQRESLGHLMLEGNDLYDKKPSPVTYIFPDHMPLNQVFSYLEENQLDVLFLCAYDREQEPDFNFDGRAVPISSINGVKPKLLVDFMEESVVQE